MGNSASSGRGHHEETVDFGYLIPQGIYSGTRDWNQTIVAQLICERKLAPFYRPLEDYEESWDDDQILAHRKEPPTDTDGQAESSSALADTLSITSSRSHKRGHASTNSKEVIRHPEAAVYRGAIECPICFLYYPPNINHSRCCDQAICTECFVQIKRAEPNPTHLVSEPASCPYCVQENFGVVYVPPTWRTGLGSEGATPPSWPDSPSESTTSMSATKRPRKSFGADSPEVVTIDHIRPDWEAKLAAVRAAVARRANRRIIMRQVGDRLVPVGISSGRVHPLAPEDGLAEAGESIAERGTRRSRRRQQNQDINQLLGTMGLGGQDLEELMVMEAMRLSLIEQEEQQKREREEEGKKAQGTGGSQASEGASTSSPTTRPLETTPPLVAEAASTSSTSVPTVRSQPTGNASDGASLPDTPTSSNLHNVRGPEIVRDSTPMLPPGSESIGSEATLPTGDGLASSSRPRTPASSSEPDDDVPLEAQRSPARPMPINRNDSFASSFVGSVEPSNYDVLSSSPESAISHKPLLRSRPATPSIVTVDTAESSPTR